MLAPSIYNPNINYLWRLILYVRGRLSVKLQIVVSGVYYLWWGVFHPGSLCNIPVHLTMYIVHWGKISFSFPRLNILLHTHLHCESGIQERDVLRRTSVLRLAHIQLNPFCRCRACRRWLHSSATRVTSSSRSCQSVCSCPRPVSGEWVPYRPPLPTIPG